MLILILDQKGVDGSVHWRLFEVPRQETFNLARLRKAQTAVFILGEIIGM
jgi:hypothetical protein